VTGWYNKSLSQLRCRETGDSKHQVAQGNTCSLCKLSLSSPALEELPKMQSKFAPALQDNIKTDMVSSLSVLIEDFCQYSCFTIKNLQVKHKELLKPFIHLCI